MDIVQYLHGLVSKNLGLFDDDIDADLLKQYYALSLALLAGQKTDITNPASQNLTALWGEQTPNLVRRLARSFHVDERHTLRLIHHATAPMLVEILGACGDGEPSEFILSHIKNSVGHLPAWSGRFIPSSLSDVLQHTKEDNPQNVSDTTIRLDIDEPTLVNLNDDDESLLQKPNANPQKPLLIGLGVGAIVLGLLTCGFYVYKHKFQTHEPSLTATTKPAQTPPRISITTGENGTLYACRAEIGNSDLHTMLLGILQKNFGQVNCVMDIDNTFGSSLVGLERLESIIAMIKSEAYTSIEIIGNQIIINSPQAEVVTRMVKDISLLAPQFTVSAAAPLNKDNLIKNSITNSQHALDSLITPLDAYGLSRAMSIQVIDFNKEKQLPAQNQALLTTYAKVLSENPNIKLMVVAHTDGTNSDRKANITLSQQQAETVKDFLLQNGVSDGQLTAKGVGDIYPIADNATELGQFKNRRIEFLVYDDAILSAMNADIAHATQIQTPAQMVQTAPYVPSEQMGYVDTNAQVQQAAIVSDPNMVQGMPQPMTTPNTYPATVQQPIYPQNQPTVASPAYAQPTYTPPAYVPPSPEVQNPANTGQINISNSRGQSISSTPSGAGISKEIQELSETTIHSEGKKGQSAEYRP